MRRNQSHVRHRRGCHHGDHLRSRRGAPAQGTAGSQGTRSLATVLAADGHRFDSNPGDVDVLERAVLRVLRVKPTSKLAVLTNGDERLTAFIPRDAAFRKMGEFLLDRRFDSERDLFRALWRDGGDTRAERADAVENVLLYHLVKGETLTARRLVRMAPTELTTHGISAVLSPVTAD